MNIERMNKGSWGKVRAFFDLTTSEGLTVKGFKIIEGINGLFVGVPSQKGKDDEYFDTVYIAPELREEVNHIAMQEYGMENAPSENFRFPEKNEEAGRDTESETEKETVPTTETTPEEETVPTTDTAPEKETKNNTFSDDDIPF